MFGLGKKREHENDLGYSTPDQLKESQLLGFPSSISDSSMTTFRLLFPCLQNGTFQPTKLAECIFSQQLGD